MGVCNLKRLNRNLRRCGEKALAKGVDELVYFGMKDEQEIVFTYDETNSTIITGVELKANEKFYSYEGNNYSTEASVGFAETDYDKTLPQQVIIRIFSNSPETKLEIESLLTRKDLIHINKRVSGPYEVYGVETGMRVTGVTYTPNDESKGAFLVTFGAPDETSLPKTLLHKTAGGIDDTKTYFAAKVTQNPA